MSAPVEVGAQGTVGSLVCREIEYFRRTEVSVGHGHGHGHAHSKKSNNKHAAAVAASVGSPRGKVRSPWKKGAGGGGAFLPSLCSSAEVAEAAAAAARVRYRHLGEDDGDSLPQG
ncbi:hypothetical protein GUJ93_ZPchr0013g37475 [Zizania palustris]|uniref:Uncharacterized protein n=1 Tax=Zizania palustris TaxID=103762 RepID=A0A8J5WY70_ZIZPA|nr:hypothetical protein GUJ93_ZPchr0013g37475 [Zizania palustris]